MTLNILENIVVFILDIRLWSGRKKLLPEDLAANGIDPDRLPPGTLASLGSKRIIGSEALAPFAALKREAEKICLAKGVRFLGGYAVPVQDAPEVHRKLEELKGRFETAKTELLQGYNEALESWIVQNPPEWAPVIRASAEDPGHVQRAFAFGFAPIQVTPADQLSDSEELEQQAQGLLGQLCHEVRVAAKSAYESSYLGRSSVTRKALRPVAAIREKLAGLCFLGPVVIDALEVIDQTLAQVPQNGPIEGPTLKMLSGLLGRKLANMGRPDGEEQEPEPSLEDEALSEERKDLPSGPLPPQPTAALAWDF